MDGNGAHEGTEVKLTHGIHDFFVNMLAGICLAPPKPQATSD